MDRRFTAALILVGLAAAAYPTLGASPPGPTERAYDWRVTAMRCGEEVCLAYNGTVPGPTLDVRVGDILLVTLRNDIASTVWDATDDVALASRLANASVSWHVHGTALGADVDGVGAHPGTKLIESVARPGGSFTYRARAVFNGTWHYHDHVLGADGAEGIDRGLYGGLIVRNGAEPPADAVLDVHLLDDTNTTHRNASATVPAGSSVDVLVVSLGNRLWNNVRLLDPQGTELDRIVAIGPGMSDRMHIADAQPGTYLVRVGTQNVGRIEVTP